MGINVRTMEDCDFANLIVKGFKTYETRKNRSSIHTSASV